MPVWRVVLTVGWSVCREAEFSELECRLTSQQVAMYDGAVRLWQDLRGALAAAQAATGGR